MAKKIATRAETNVWLVGQLLPNISEVNATQLPTAGIVLRRLYHSIRIRKLNLSQSCNEVSVEVMEFWILANIATTQLPNVVSRLKALYNKHDSLSRNKLRRNERQQFLESAFTASLAKLFDIAHSDCSQLIRIPQDLDFLEDQRSVRKMAMGSEDREFKVRNEKRMKRLQDNLNRSQLEESRKVSLTDTRTEAPSDDGLEPGIDDASTYSSDEDDVFAHSSYHRKRIMLESAVIPPLETLELSCPNLEKRCIIDNALFNASLDRTNTTPRQAMHIVAPALVAAGVDLQSITLSTTSLYEARKDTREAIGSSVRESFSPKVPLIVHFDGKMLPDCDGVKGDRMQVVVSGKCVKLLGIPRLPNTSGEQMGRKIVQLLHEWTGVAPHLAGLCFDTTASNTGIHSGAITVVQASFNRRLLYFACRHHILELLADVVFDLFFVSSGPEIALFKRFKEQWSFIDQDAACPLDGDASGNSALSDREYSWLLEHRDTLSKPAKPNDVRRVVPTAVATFLAVELTDFCYIALSKFISSPQTA